MDVYLGTAGFAFDKWKDEGMFYPPDVKTSDEKLFYYSGVFNSLTLSMTFSHNPPFSLFTSWVNICRHNPKFLFNVYAPHNFTDSKSINSSMQEWNSFWNGNNNEFDEKIGGCRYLYEKKVLGCLILRFCPGFDNTNKNINKILKITKNIPSDVRVAFIFLHSSWFTNSTRELFKKKGNWCLATSFVTNNLIDAGSLGNLKSTKTTQTPVIETATSNFAYISLNGSYGPEIGPYDKDGFLEKLKKEIKTSKTKEIFCSFDNTAETTYKYPLPGVFISNFYVCPQILELPPDCDGLDRHCCLHDILKMKKLMETYVVDSDGYLKIKFVKTT